MKQKLIDLISGPLYFLVAPAFRKQILEAKKTHYRYGVDDTIEKYDIFAEQNWHVDPFQVIAKTQEGQLAVVGKPLTSSEVLELKTEATFFKNSRLWKIMQETVRQKAIEKAVLQSKNYEEVLSGKLMVHNLSLQKSILELVDNYIVPK